MQRTRDKESIGQWYIFVDMLSMHESSISLMTLHRCRLGFCQSSHVYVLLHPYRFTGIQTIESDEMCLMHFRRTSRCFGFPNGYELIDCISISVWREISMPIGCCVATIHQKINIWEKMELLVLFHFLFFSFGKWFYLLSSMLMMVFRFHDNN